MARKSYTSKGKRPNVSKNIRKAINFAQECSTNVVQKHGVTTI